MKKSLLLFAAFLPLSLMAQTFSDDFESYTTGQYIGAVSPQWTTWSGATGGAEDAQVTTANPNSGVHSIYFSSTASTGGPQDVVLPFGGAHTSGSFNYQMSMFVNTNTGAYFNFQGTTTIGQTWALDVTFNNTGTVEFTSGGGLMLSTSYSQNAWFDLEINADLNTNTWEVFIDGVSEGIFQNNVNSIASLDLFPLQGHQFYVDDVQYTFTPFSMPTLNAAAYGINNMTGLATQEVTPDLVVRNLGTTALTSFDVMLDYDGSQYTENVTGVNVASNGTYTVTLSSSIMLVAGNTPVTLTVSNVNGGTDNYAPDDSKTIYINPVVPASGKMVVAEEGTGTWCGWCPRGAVYMELLDQKYDGFIVPIAVHNSDPMTITEYDDAMGVLVSGYPSALVDRGAEIDPSQIEPDFLDRIVTAPVTLIQNGANWNSSTRELQVSITATFQNAGSGSNYQVACVLTENGVTGTASGYAQTNYYSGGGNGVMGGYESLPNPVPASQMVYDFVARALSPSFGGLPGSYPSSVSASQSFTHNFTFVLPSDWDENEMHIVGMVVNPGGEIDNADYTTIPEAVTNGFVSGTVVTEVTEMNSPDAVANLYPNPATEISTLDLNLSEETEVNIEIFSIDGKLMASKNYGKLNGNYHFPIVMNGWENGIYTVRITTSGSVMTKQVVKQ